MTASVGINDSHDSSFKRDSELETALMKQGLTYTETLDWGMTVRYIHVEAPKLEEALDKIRINKQLLERAYGIIIDLEKIHIAPEMMLSSR